MLTPSEFLDSYCEIGYKKARSPAGRILLLAILAGILIGMGAVVSNTSSHALENLSVARVVCGFLFPFGLVMVLFTGAELFTGNCLITIPVLERRVAWTGMLRNLCWVYIGNLIGAVLLAAVIVYSGQLNLSDGALAVCTIRTAAAKCSLSFGRAVVLGILCNVLVCIGVMCGLCAKSAAGRTLGAFLPVCFFVICGFEHCVANMYYIPAGLLALEVPHYAELAREAGVAVESLTWSRFFLQNLLPVTVGNLMGGCGFAALIWSVYHPRGPLERRPLAGDAGVAAGPPGHTLDVDITLFRHRHHGRVAVEARHRAGLDGRALVHQHLGDDPLLPQEVHDEGIAAGLLLMAGGDVHVPLGGVPRLHELLHRLEDVVQITAVVQVDRHRHTGVSGQRAQQRGPVLQGQSPPGIPVDHQQDG